MVASSWLQSFSSSSKSSFLTRYLRKCGQLRYLLSNFLTGPKASDAVTRELVQEKEDKIGVKSLQDLEDVENIIGYSFNNRRLLYQAFTHPSYGKNCAPYERLEYVGDSVLNLLITVHQFSLYPDLPPGCLTPLRAANVDTEKLARAAIKHNFHKYLRHRRPGFEKGIQAFINALPQYPLHSHGLIDAPKVLADIVESTIGAVFVDSNSSIDTTWKVTRVLLEPIITPDMLQTNPVKKLFEICQKNKLDVQLVDRWSQKGTYEVFVDNQLRGRGKGRVKKEVALNRAAHEAYKEVIRTLSAR